MWSSRPSLKKMWGCVHHLQRDLCRLIRAAGRCCWEVAGGVQLSPCVPKRPLYLGTRAREQGGPWPLASFYLRFTNVGCKTWIAICTKRKVKLFPPPLDLRASHSNPFSRRLSSCAQRNITLVLKPSGGLVCRLLNNEGKKKKASKPYVCNGLQFYKSMLIGECSFQHIYPGQSTIFHVVQDHEYSLRRDCVYICLHVL